MSGQTLSDGRATRCIKLLSFSMQRVFRKEAFGATLTSRARSDKPINGLHDMQWRSFRNENRPARGPV
jgi:hypothetical protein